jgi:hypothetical protein
METLSLFALNFCILSTRVDMTVLCKASLNVFVFIIMFSTRKAYMNVLLYFV